MGAQVLHFGSKSKVDERCCGHCESSDVGIVELVNVAVPKRLHAEYMLGNETDATDQVQVGSGEEVIFVSRLERLGLLKRFDAFIQSFGKNISDGDFETRFAAFMVNAKHIDEVNQNDTYSFKVGLTEYADMTHEEFKGKYLGYKR